MTDFETEYKTKHKRLSLIKSVIRIAGGGLSLYIMGPTLSAIAFALMAFIAAYTIAEVVGVWEEMI